MSTSPDRLERQHRRFPLRFPVQVRFAHGNSTSEIHADSRNVSISGLLLETDVFIPEHTAVNFMMTVQAGHMVRPIELVGQGQVVRVEQEGSAGRFAIAIQCHRPLIEIATLA